MVANNGTNSKMAGAATSRISRVTDPGVAEPTTCVVVEVVCRVAKGSDKTDLSARDAVTMMVSLLTFVVTDFHLCATEMPDHEY